MVSRFFAVRVKIEQRLLEHRKNPMTGEEATAMAMALANDTFAEKLLAGTHGSQTFAGELVQAGTDREGQPFLLIHATAEELRSLNPLPLYQPANITIHPRRA